MVGEGALLLYLQESPTEQTTLESPLRRLTVRPWLFRGFISAPRARPNGRIPTETGSVRLARSRALVGPNA